MSSLPLAPILCHTSLPFSSSHSKHFSPSNLIDFQVTCPSLCLESSALILCMGCFQSLFRSLLKLTSSERLSLTSTSYPWPFTLLYFLKKITFTTSCLSHFFFAMKKGVKERLHEWSHSLTDKIQFFIYSSCYCIFHIYKYSSMSEDMSYL